MHQHAEAIRKDDDADVWSVARRLWKEGGFGREEDPVWKSSNVKMKKRAACDGQ